MSNIEVNPDELRIFEVSLRDLRGEVQAQRIALERETHDVQKFWDDEKYKKFLSMGSSAKPTEIAALVGADISNPEFWRKSLKYIEHLIDELEETL